MVQENVLNQEENDRFEYHKNYADLHLLVEGHEYSSYGSRVKDEAVAFDEASDIGFVHCHEQYPLLLGYHKFCSLLPRGASSAERFMQAWRIRFASICLKFN